MVMRKFVTMIAAVALLLGLAVPAAAYGGGTAGRSTTISCGHVTSAAIDKDGALWMWGRNEHGELGIGTREKQSATPRKVLDDVVSVSVGGFHVMAVKADGSLWGWGSNLSGELGIAATTSAKEYAYSPVEVMDGVAAVSAGNNCTAAIKTDGSLWMWGSTSFGQLGVDIPDGQYISLPVKVMDNVAAVSAGNSYTAAVKTDGSLWVWGLNREYRLNGASSLDDGTVETAPVKLMDGVASVSVGYNHTVAVKKDGSLWTWGSNEYGQIGNGGEGNTTYRSYTLQTVPVKVMDGVASAEAGYAYTAAVKTDGTLWTWGMNVLDRLGNGGKSNAVSSYDNPCQNVPMQIMDNVTAVTAGTNFGTAIKTDGSFWVWGHGEYGSLGLGTTDSAPSPVQGPKLSVQQPGTAAFNAPSGHNGQPVSTRPAFSDVPADAWYAEAVAWAVEKGITSGTSSTVFSPGQNCTTAQILTFLWRANGSPEPAGTNPFSDVSTDDWYSKPALWAYEKGLVYGSALQGKELCTRSDVVMYLWKLAGMPVPEERESFADVSSHASVEDSISWAVEQDITSGVSWARFAPDEPCTRGQIAAFLYRAMK